MKRNDNGKTDGKNKKRVTIYKQDDDRGREWDP